MRLSVLAIIVLVASSALSGCLVGHRTTEPDADVDGLPDRLETGGWNITVHKTVRACGSAPGSAGPAETRLVKSNMLREDTDADGVPDYQEYLLQSDPNSTDTDADGLTDLQEYELRTPTSTNFAPFLLSLNKADSDDDCLSDKQEVDGFDIPGIGHRVTDPTIADTDHDGWTDEHEVFHTHTDPTDPDTDHDGASDRLDADPLHNLWVNWTFSTVNVKAAEGRPSRVHLVLDWTTLQTPKQSRPTPLPSFDAPVGGSSLVPGNNSPGRFNQDDQLAGDVTQLQLHAWTLDATGQRHYLYMDPAGVNLEATLRLNLTTGQWAFRDDAEPGGFTAYGTQTTLDGKDARLTFTLDVERPART